MNRLCSPNLWVAIACGSAVLGCMLAVSGTVGDVPILRTVGLALISPIVVGGLVLAIIVIPILVLANRKRNQKTPKE